MSKGTTHFGYARVAVDDKASRVGAVFDSVAERYDLMNDLMSLGVHRLWKRFAVHLAQARSGERILDLAGGTGDLSRRFAGQVGDEGLVVLADINAEMLEIGRRRLVDAGAVANVRYVRANAEALPFAGDTFDCVAMAFGLRNVTRKDAALASIHRVLRPGGRCFVLEFSAPRAAWLRPVYERYSFTVLPWLGKVVAGDASSYRYLAESIRMHPDQEELRSMMQTAGFERCSFFNLSAGIVALHRGYKL